MNILNSSIHCYIATHTIGCEKKLLLLESVIEWKVIICNLYLSRCKGFKYNYYHENSNANIHKK